MFTGQRAECPSIDMLNKRGDRDYSKDTELLKNGDFHEYKGGRGEFLLIQSYDMFVSTLTQAVVRARTFAPGEKMSVFAVVNTGNILKKGSHWASMAFQIKKKDNS